MISISWSAEPRPGPPSPVAKFLSPPADAVAVRRGPLLFALHPEEERVVVQRYDCLPPDRPRAVDYEIRTSAPWNFALRLPSAPADGATLTGATQSVAADPTALFFDATPSAGWSASRPFDTDSYPFSVRAPGVRLSSWGYWRGSKITSQPPASPVDCGRDGVGCAASDTPLRLVPFGGTNVRIAVFPWVASARRLVEEAGPPSGLSPGDGGTPPSWTAPAAERAPSGRLSSRATRVNMTVCTTITKAGSCAGECKAYSTPAGVCFSPADLFPADPQARLT